ncbi:MAG TPA: PAS domain-containing sensor histidine kinase, partial [Kofleriaceae bacterium]
AIAFEYAPKCDEMRYVAPQLHRLLGSETTRIQREFMREVIHPDDRERVRGTVREYAEGGTTGRIEYRLLRPDGAIVHVRTLLGERTGDVVRGVTIDATKQTRLEAERREAHKLESVGRLAAGVAHEINTPVQFTQDSMQFVRESIDELADAILRHRKVSQALLSGEDSLQATLAAARAAVTADETADLEYLIEHVPPALGRANHGLERISTIVRSLRELAGPERVDRTTIDLGDALGDTLASARVEYEAVCELTTDYANLPRVSGNRNELRQVFSNLFGNAARSIGDTGRRGTIAVTGRHEGEFVTILVADTGLGIPLEVRHLVFEPFFTTRDVGKARGQGLAVSRAVIAKHGGTLTFETEDGKGTTFAIRLPIAKTKQTMGQGQAAA